LRMTPILICHDVVKLYYMHWSLVAMMLMIKSWAWIVKHAQFVELLQKKRIVLITKVDRVQWLWKYFLLGMLLPWWRNNWPQGWIHTISAYCPRCWFGQWGKSNLYYNKGAKLGQEKARHMIGWHALMSGD
jgi:hypothetical protein